MAEFFMNEKYGTFTYDSDEEDSTADVIVRDAWMDRRHFGRVFAPTVLITAKWSFCVIFAKRMGAGEQSGTRKKLLCVAFKSM